MQRFGFYLAGLMGGFVFALGIESLLEGKVGGIFMLMGAAFVTLYAVLDSWLTFTPSSTPSPSEPESGNR